jgi:hypothetical protein
MLIMAAKTPKCPTCGQAPSRIDHVREPVTSGFGFAPEPRIVERATCPNGHQWYQGDEHVSDVETPVHVDVFDSISLA